jgi:hypothetical protein
MELELALILHLDQFGWVGPSRSKNPTDIAHGFIETNKPPHYDKVQCRKKVGHKKAMCLISSRRHTTVILLQRPKEIQNKDSRKFLKRTNSPERKLDKKAICLITSRRHTTVILLQRPREIQNKDSRQIIKRTKAPRESWTKKAMCLITSRRHTTVILLQRPKKVQDNEG